MPRDDQAIISVLEQQTVGGLGTKNPKETKKSPAFGVGLLTGDYFNFYRR